jgi:hypothetical protein
MKQNQWLEDFILYLSVIAVVVAIATVFARQAG